MNNRVERAESAIREAAAEFLVREAGPQSLVTVTASTLAPDFSRAMILLSVLPQEKEEAAVAFANRNAVEFKTFLKTRVKLGRVPHIEFAIDRGEENRRRIEELSKQ